MKTTFKNPQAEWYLDLSTRFEELVSVIGINEDQASEIKVFLLQVAKDQYMRGNRSGIKWSPTRKTWTRKTTPNAIRATKYLTTLL